MKFEIGKKYVCRDGSIATYEGKVKPGDGKAKCYTDVFVLNGDRHFYTVDGKFYAFCGEHRLDIIKEQPMQIEAGKFYKTRDGRKAFVCGVMLPNPVGGGHKFPVFGYIEGCPCMLSWTTEGFDRVGMEKPNDLVSEWIDPPQEITVDGVVYVRKEK